MFQVDCKGTQPFIYMYPFSPKLPSHPGCRITLSSSLCSTVGPCWLSVLNIALCTCPSLLKGIKLELLRESLVQRHGIQSSNPNPRLCTVLFFLFSSERVTWPLGIVQVRVPASLLLHLENCVCQDLCWVFYIHHPVWSLHGPDEAPEAQRTGVTLQRWPG